MRLFFAVEIPRNIQKQIYDSLAGLRMQIPDIRWTSQDNLHITLKFLGEVQESMLTKIQECARICVSGIQSGTFDITFSGIGAFPGVKRPRVIWCGIREKVRTLSLLAEGLETKLEPLGFKKEDRPYRPHLTIGKAGPEGKAKGLENFILEYEKTIFAGISVNMISLMQSVLNPRGTVYQCIHQIYL